MAMFVERSPRKRKNVVVTVRNKNNMQSTDFQTLRKVRPNITSCVPYKTPISTNVDTSRVSSPD